MTNEEAEQAFIDDLPVMWNGILYLGISAIIYRKDAHRRVIVSAELKDKNKNSATIARIQEIQGVS